MNWDAIGALGEIVGALTVVVTLVYLANQIRQATRATQAASFQATSALEQDFLLGIGQDPGTARTWATYMFGDPATLSEDERLQAMFLMGAMLRRLENVYHQHQLKTISDDAWLSRQKMFATVAHSSAFGHFLTAPARAFVGEEFIDFMRRLMPEHLGPDSDPASRGTRAT